MSEPSLSVVIPAYNEESRIVPSIERIVQYLNASHKDYELIVVDDGSSDRTAGVVQNLAKGNPKIRLLSNPQNEGKGNSVKKGVLAAKGDVIFFTDADLSTPIEEIEKFLEELKRHDIVIGSRSIEGANVELHEPIYRELLGKLFNKFVQILCVPGIVDTQCGAKMFKREAAMKIFPLIKTARFSFDVEALFLARRFGHRIKELPIRWLYSANTRVRTFQDGPKMLWDLLQIRWIHRNTKKNVA